MKTVQAFETSFLPPTDHKGSRIRVRNVTTRKSRILPWDYELDADENHAEACKTVLADDRAIATRTALHSGGFLFTVAIVPAVDEPNAPTRYPRGTLRTFLVDGACWWHVRTETDPSGGLRVYARPDGDAMRGAVACFSVPQTQGKFRTGGHSFNFGGKS